ncbi:MAG: Slp family lipoprotein [Candidatus Dasytiphilus stammeri]
MLKFFSNFIKWIVITTLSFSIFGCSSVPNSIMDKGLYPPEQNLKMIMKSPHLYINKDARFGGKVIKVINNPNMTRLVIATMPLTDKNASPILNSFVIGRIYADIKDFFDPLDFYNQLITVSGTIEGTEQGYVNQQPYKFLVMKINGYQLWHKREHHHIIIPPFHQQRLFGFGCYNNNWDQYYDYEEALPIISRTTTGLIPQKLT